MSSVFLKRTSEDTQSRKMTSASTQIRTSISEDAQSRWQNLSLPFPTIPKLEEKVKHLEAKIDSGGCLQTGGCVCVPLAGGCLNAGLDQQMVEKLQNDVAVQLEAALVNIKDNIALLASKEEVDDKMIAFYRKTEIDNLLQQAKVAYEKVFAANQSILEGIINTHKTTMERKCQHIEQAFNVHDKEVCQSVENVWSVLAGKMSKSEMYSKDDIDKLFSTKNEVANKKAAMQSELDIKLQAERVITNNTIDVKIKDVCTKTELEEQLGIKAAKVELAQIKKDLDQKAWNWEGYTIEQINTRFGNRVKKEDVYTKQAIDDMLSQKAGTEDVQKMLQTLVEKTLLIELSKKADAEKVYTKQDVDVILRAKADVPYYLHNQVQTNLVTSININFAFDHAAADGKTLQEKILLKPSDLRMHVQSTAALFGLGLETIKKLGTWEYFLMAEAIDDVVELGLCELETRQTVAHSGDDFQIMLGLKTKQLMVGFDDNEFDGSQLGTIKLLGTWKLAECASAIVTLAELEEEVSTQVESSPLFKKAKTQSKSPKNILREPLSALCLPSQIGDVNFEELGEKFDIKTIGDLGKWKHYKLARAICQLAKHNIPNNAEDLKKVCNGNPSSLNNYAVDHDLNNSVNKYLQELGISTVKDLGKWKLAKRANAMSTLAEHMCEGCDTTQASIARMLPVA